MPDGGRAATHHDALLAPLADDEASGTWMISYIDVMTLLVALFALLLSVAGASRGSEVPLATGTPVVEASRISPSAVVVALGIAGTWPVATATGVPLLALPAPLPLAGLLVAPSIADVLAAPWKADAPAAPWKADAPMAPFGVAPGRLAGAVSRQLERVPAVVAPVAVAAAERLVAGSRDVPSPAAVPSPSEANSAQIHQAEAELPNLEGVQVSRVTEGLNLRVQDHLLFDSAEATLTDSGRAMIDRLVGIVNRYEGRVSVEGHSDSREINTERFPSNWELSAGRATAILRQLQRAGVDAHRLRAVGYADTRPLADNRSLEGRAANRRVEVIVHL